MNEQERFIFELGQVKITNRPFLLRIDFDYRLLTVEGEAVHKAPSLNQRVSLHNVCGVHVRLMSVHNCILTVDVGRVEVLGLPQGKHPVDKRQIGKKFGPGYTRDDFAIGMCFLKNLKERGKKNILAPATLALGDDVLFFRHWLLVCNVIVAWVGLQ